jgi:hypothetical protein
MLKKIVIGLFALSGIFPARVAWGSAPGFQARGDDG